MTSRAAMPRILGMPRWLAFSLLTILLWGTWGVVSKVASEGVDAYSNQALFSFGLLPLIALVWRSPRNAAGGAGRRSGIGWAFLTGILGGLINIKAGTNEGCDAIGRGEAIAAHAVVLLGAFD